MASNSDTGLRCFESKTKFTSNQWHSQRQRLNAEVSTLKAKAWTLKAKAKPVGPEAKAFMHMGIEEIKIRSTSDGPTG